MRIDTGNYTLTLDPDARPSVEDMNDIIGSVTKDGTNEDFQALVHESANWPADLTNWYFKARCEAWVAEHALTLEEV